MVNMDEKFDDESKGEHDDIIQDHHCAAAPCKEVSKCI